jgi:hypothetical protein
MYSENSIFPGCIVFPHPSFFFKTPPKENNESRFPCIYKRSKNKLLVNNAYIGFYNPIFEALQEVNTRERHMQAIKESINSAQQAVVTTNRKPAITMGHTSA